MAFSTHDQVPDSPTNVFATLNPLENYATGTFSDGNTKGVTTSSGYGRFISTIRPTTGKYYCEFYIVDASRFNVGIENSKTAGGTQGGATENSLIVFYNGNAYYNSTSYVSYLTSNLANGNIVGVALDLDNKNIFISVNGTYAKSATSTEIQNGTSTNSLNTHCSVTKSVLFDGDIGIFFEDNSASGLTSAVANFGADSTFGGLVGTSPLGSEDTGATFRYAPPTGFKALSTANLADPDIDPAVDDLPEDYFKAVTYTGTGPTSAASSDRFNINHGLSFTPDLMWFKSRSDSNWNVLFDSVRGEYSSALGYDVISSNSTYGGHAANSWSSNYRLYGVDDSKFIFNNGVATNEQNKNYVAWCFRAGGSPTADNTATSGAMTANSVSVDGTLQSSYTPSGSPTVYPTRMSVNTKAGFSIIKYTGNTNNSATVPHGLNQKPDFIIVKHTNYADHWSVYHSALGATKYLYLNGTNSEFTDSSRWSNIEPTTDVFTTGTNSPATNGSYNYITYCWHSVAGYSAFGSYTGNGSADGPFVYTGFKPAWLMVKGADSSTHWRIYDNKRPDPFYNAEADTLYANESYQEDNTSERVDFLSGGFKIRSSTTHNASNEKFIFMAFAEMPFKYATAR